MCYVDVDLAKKELFAHGTSSFSTDPDTDDKQSEVNDVEEVKRQLDTTPAYKKREDYLWSKLFN